MIFPDSKPIGGEAEYAPSHFRALTQSGRASLRLIIESGQLQGRHFWLPDCLCEAITAVLDGYQISYDFYPIGADLRPDLSALPLDVEVLYIINYFGQETYQTQFNPLLNNAVLIIDDVFYPSPRLPQLAGPCYAFNSLRKISPLADGSILVANQPLLNHRVRTHAETDFSRLKYQAKKQKYHYLHPPISQATKTDSEQESQYLATFQQAETLLSNSISSQAKIMGMSTLSQLAAFDFFTAIECERRSREQNFHTLKQALPGLVLPLRTDFYSFAILVLPGRDRIRQELMCQKIYLPVHWPEYQRPSRQVLNQQCLNWLSVPLDPRYEPKDMIRVAKAISELASD